MAEIERKWKSSGACPKFFRVRCREAARGGTDGYDSAGSALAGATAAILCEDLADEDAGERLDALAAAIWNVGEDGLIGTPDDDAVLAWYDRELPRCMALVPRRRRWSFLKGVYRWTRDENNNITTY